MSSVLVTDSKYQFVPPHEGAFWPMLFARCIPWYVKRKFGITQMEVRGAEKLTQLLKQGHGVLLAPNHCRMSDAMVLQHLAFATRQPFYIMASAHLFRQNKLLSWMLRRLGAFSVYREGIDQQAVRKAIEILVEGQRPLVLFPEGALSQSNDRLNALQEGISLIARSAASKLEKQNSSDGSNRRSSKQVCALPVAIRYLYKGDIEPTADKMLSQIEQRLSWRPLTGQGLVERIYRVGTALLSLKEIEYLGQSQSGEIDERLNRLINHLLVPVETEWFGSAKEGSVIVRVKEIRRAILPDIIEGTLSTAEVDRRWRQLEDTSFAQALSLYPSRYIASKPTVDRILETVERLNEHFCGDESPHPPMKAVLVVGDPIEISPKRDRTAKVDPILQAIETQLVNLLEHTVVECAMYDNS